MRPAPADSGPSHTAPTWLTRVWNAPWLWMVLVITIFCVPLFVGLDQQDLENDEAIYSFSVDVMLKSGDWLTPRNNPDETSPFLEKPPLKFWIVALPIRWGLLPDDEAGMRFWDAVMGSVAFLYVLAIGRRLAGPVCGLVAVLLLFVHGPLVFDHGLRTNNMEAAVFLTYAAGMYHWLAWRSASPDNRGHLLAIALYFVLGFMTKFVAALFLPLVIGILALLTPEDRLRLRLNWPTFALAGVLAFVLIAPWFVYQYITHGAILFDTLLREHVVRRFTVFVDPAHVHPWHHYFSEIWRHVRENGTASLTLAGAALLIVNTIRRRWIEGALVVAWFAIPLGLMSIGTSKLYHYAYPFLPPVALAGGYAAALLVGIAWRWLERPTEALVELRDRVAPGWLRRAPARVFFTVFGIGALAVGVATGMWDRIRIAVDDTIILRSSNAARPIVAGAVSLLAGGHALAIRAILPLLVLLSVAPLPAYHPVIRRAQNTVRPLHEMRACLTPIVDRLVAQGQKLPGVWIEAASYSRAYHYYLHGFGTLWVRDRPSDGTVAMHLFAPGFYRPVLLSNARYDEFKARLNGDRAWLVDQAARHSDLAPEAVLEGLQRTSIGVIPYDGLTLLLPGPFSVCGPVRSFVDSQ